MNKYDLINRVNWGSDNYWMNPLVLDVSLFHPITITNRRVAVHIKLYTNSAKVDFGDLTGDSKVEIVM